MAFMAWMRFRGGCGGLRAPSLEAPSRERTGGAGPRAQDLCEPAARQAELEDAIAGAFRNLGGRQAAVRLALVGAGAPLRADRVLKMRAYAHFGVRQCWLVDPDAQSLGVFSLSSSGYVLARVASCGETVRSDLFPELSLALDEVFAPDE